MVHLKGGAYVHDVCIRIRARYLQNKAVVHCRQRELPIQHEGKINPRTIAANKELELDGGGGRRRRVIEP